MEVAMSRRSTGLPTTSTGRLTGRLGPQKSPDQELAGAFPFPLTKGGYSVTPPSIVHWPTAAKQAYCLREG